MIGWLSLGLVVGFAAGFATAWYVVRGRPVQQRTEPASAPSLAPEPALAEPISGREHALLDERTDEEINHALDATKGLLDELEGRYRGRTAPAEDEGQRPRRRPRRPRA